MDQMNLIEVEKTVESIPMGQKAYYSKTISEADITVFTGITGDRQALSTNAVYAATTPLGRCAVQSELLASFTWPVSTQIASPGAVTIGQELRFLNGGHIHGKALDGSLQAQISTALLDVLSGLQFFGGATHPDVGGIFKDFHNLICLHIGILQNFPGRTGT